MAVRTPIATGGRWQYQGEPNTGARRFVILSKKTFLSAGRIFAKESGEGQTPLSQELAAGTWSESMFAVRPSIAFAFIETADAFTKTATRWRIDPVATPGRL